MVTQLFDRSGEGDSGRRQTPESSCYDTSSRCSLPSYDRYRDSFLILLAQLVGKKSEIVGMLQASAPTSNFGKRVSRDSSDQSPAKDTPHEPSLSGEPYKRNASKLSRDQVELDRRTQNLERDTQSKFDILFTREAETQSRLNSVLTREAETQAKFDITQNLLRETQLKLDATQTLLREIQTKSDLREEETQSRLTQPSLKLRLS
uniref:Uncharacterized protein n=1 Tax=Ditylenchus dipsaci TaxID=166011 RepID=A0A915DUJ1_9BILA